MVRLSVIQFSPVWGNKQHNLGAIEQLLANLETDIAVLPELCTTGYSFLTKKEAFEEADEVRSRAIKLFGQIAGDRGMMLIAGFAERDKENVYNSALIASPDGSLKVYRKTHLFFKEKLCFSPGDSGFFVVRHPVVDCRVGVMVCNDWRYPEAARSLALLGADLIACPSNLVSTVWGIGMPARALENKVYLAVANRCGTEKRQVEDGGGQTLTFNGGSAVYDVDGSALAKANAENDTILSMHTDPLTSRDKHFNPYNDLLKDRRPDQYFTG
jgi:predicted amidohydrolase